MSSWIQAIRRGGGGILVLLLCVGTTHSRESYWQGDNTSSEWNNAQNWFTVGAPGGGAFVPQVAGGVAARVVIGTDNTTSGSNLSCFNTPFGCPTISAQLPQTPASSDKSTIGGIYLGTRERNLPADTFVNTPAPAPGALVGALTISAGTLSSVSTTEASAGADGRIYVGQDGRGYLTMTGGSLSGTALIVGGEFVTTGNGTSQVSLSGSSSLTINGPSTLGRRLRIEGPNVNFSSTGNVTFDTANTYTAAITGLTHSPIKTPLNVLFGGSLVVEYSGPAPAIGQTWNLVDYGGGLAVNLINLSAGGDVPITGVPTPQLGEAYRLKKATGGTNGKLLQLVHEAIPVLVVDRDTGEMSITNPFNGTIEIESYEIRSDLGSLLPTYKGISGAPAGDTGWVKAPLNSATRLVETKPFGTLNLGTHPLVSLGDADDDEQGFDKHAVADNIANFGTDGEDLQFFYTTSAGVFGGHVQYVGTKFENNLVLRVVAATGEAFLKNDSKETLKFDGYSIESSTGALESAGWDGLGGTWIKTDIEPDTLSETNLDANGSLTLAPGAEVPIGDIGTFATQAARDGLSMEFILSEALEAPPGAPGGDYNNDGIVDAADYILARHQGLDEGVWSANFGATFGTTPVETEFRIGSVVFDLGGGGSDVVPEPDTVWLMLFGLAAALVLCPIRGQRLQRSFTNAILISNQNTNHRVYEGAGERTMSRRFTYYLTIAICVSAALIITQPAAAIEGIELVNYDFTAPGPLNEKTLAFTTAGVPVAGAIPGWTFTGPGVEDYGHAGILGDSGTDGGPGGSNELILSTLDGQVYQDAPDFTIHSITDKEVYKFSFIARSFFTVKADSTPVENGSQLTVKYYYGGNRNNVLATQVINPTTTNTKYELLIPHNSGLLPGVLGQTIGIEFDDTSIEYSDANELGVAKSWVGIDNVIMQISPVVRGDLNLDGALTSADYTTLKNNLQRTSCSLVPGVDGCPFEANGELTGDNKVDLNDFREFKTMLTGGGGSGVLDGGGADVFGDGFITPGAFGGGGGSAGNASAPEPSTAMLVLLMTAIGSLFTCRGRGASRLTNASMVFGVSMAAVTLSAAPTQAALLAYDPFVIGDYEYLDSNENPQVSPQYTVGFLDDTLAGGGGQNPQIGLPPTPSFFSTGWYRRSNGDAARAAVQNTSLVYRSIDPEPNSGSGWLDRVSTPPEGFIDTNGRIGRSLASPWTNSTTGTFYVSWLVDFGTLGTNPNDLLGYRGLEFWDETTMPNGGDADIAVSYDAYSGPISPPRNGDRSRMFVRYPGGGTQILTNSPASFNADGNVHLVVFKFQLSSENNSDTLTVYLNPPTAIEPDFGSMQAAGLNIQVGSLGFAMYGGDVSGTDPYNGIIVDDLRIADTFADALPALPVPGDTDGDRDVDDDDLATIMANMNRIDVEGGPSEGDVAFENGDIGSDRRVTIADFWLWKRNYGFVGGGGGGSSEVNMNIGVPEPSSLWLLMAAAMSLGCRRRRARSVSAAMRSC